MPKCFIIFSYKQNNMNTSIPELYSMATGNQKNGIQGYFVQKKYIDPNKLKEQKMLQNSKDKPQSSKPVNVSKKTTFIDQVQKLSAKLPGPTTYEPKQIQHRSKTTSVVPVSNRKTIFDEMADVQKKFNYPPAGKYDKIQTQVDRTKMKSNLSKAQNSTYLQSSMRNSLDAPGVGNYNAHHAIFDHRGSKWVLPKNKSHSASGVKLPPVGTYNPVPVSFKLFQSVAGLEQKKGKSVFDKEERFKKSRQKPLPFYNILSQWGMKSKIQKKDILSKVSSSVSHRSVYY